MSIRRMREIALAKSPSSAIVEPLIPPAQHGLRERSINAREVLNGSFNLLWAGCCRRQLLKGLPLRTIVSGTVNWSTSPSFMQRCASR
jgi:hypothetical protein